MESAGVFKRKIMSSLGDAVFTAIEKVKEAAKLVGGEVAQDFFSNKIGLLTVIVVAAAFFLLGILVAVVLVD